jgi:hypothetical protein
VQQTGVRIFTGREEAAISAHGPGIAEEKQRPRDAGLVPPELDLVLQDRELPLVNQVRGERRRDFEEIVVGYWHRVSLWFWK